MNHAASRELYGKHVTDFPQVKRLFTDSYCRLMAMKLFAYRATDYLRSASADDRRYLLFNPIVKMKVTMQGEQVIIDLADIVAAKGFEKEPFFEIAAKEVGMLPKLEGTAHVNMALIVKFMKNYFFNPAEYTEIPRRDDHANDAFLFNQGPTRGLGDIRFHDYHPAYAHFDLPNIEVFKQQIDSFKTLLVTAGPDDAQIKNLDYMLGLGELFTLVVYGQLILENAVIENTDEDLLNQIFAVFVRDFSSYAVDLHGKPGNSERQCESLLGLIKAPIANPRQFERVWLEQVYSLKGQYKFNE
jgi:acyl-CoA dehydrogenase